MFIGILISFYFFFALLLASITNSIQIGLKTKKLKVFTFAWFWLVSLVGQKIVAATLNIQLPSERL